MWFSYSPEFGYDEHYSEQEAREEAESSLSAVDSDPWPEDVNQVCWGVVIERATEVNREETPGGEYDYTCDYKLLPVKHSCTCDEIRESPCPVHAHQNELDDLRTRFQNEIKQLQGVLRDQQELAVQYYEEREEVRRERDSLKLLLSQELHTGQSVCPWCGTEIDGLWELKLEDGETAETWCAHCSRPITATAHVARFYEVST